MSNLFANMKPAKVDSTRNDDGPGVYFQRIDDVRIEKSQKGDDYLKIVKTNLVVVDNAEGKAKQAGEQVTHAMFRDARYNYFERDVRRFLRAALGLTDPEANELTDAKIAELLTAQRDVLKGTLVEVRVDVRPKAKKPTENFANVVYTRGVDVSEIPEAARKKFGIALPVPVAAKK